MSEPIPAELAVNRIQNEMENARSRQEVEAIQKKIDALQNEYMTKSGGEELKARLENLEQQLGKIEAKLSPPTSEVVPEMQVDDDWIL